ncbi:hypothetical protein M405DRAFT_882378 [Rhizopogon salebrosus TDB-379]|nr:hypothetical protein M405DRAFT_882378 [Rhizopogon salebrosus TDB-379]
MPSWILPGRKNDPVIRYKAILEKSFAYSYSFNPRNLEYHWYPLWGQTLSDLVADIPNLMVASQYPAWFVPHDDQEDQNDGSDNSDDRDHVDHGDDEEPGEVIPRDDKEDKNVVDDELEGVIPQDDRENASDDDDEPEEVISEEGETQIPNASGLPGDNEEVEDNEEGELDLEEENLELSFALTVPEKKARSVLVDFAIIHVSGEPHSHQPDHYGGWKITEANAGLFLEVKRSVSRSLEPGEEFDKELDAIIGEARDELINQAAHLFIQNKNQDSVLAIAASGQYWCNTKISRAHHEVEDQMHRLSAKDPTYQQTSGQKPGPKLKWSNLIRLDITRSNDRLHTVYKNLMGMGVSKTPVDV